IDACRACATDRHLLRTDVHALHADLRPAASAKPGWARQRAGLRHRLCADFFRWRSAAMADEHVGWNFARHRQYETAIADDSFLGILPDNSRRYAWSRSWADPAIRHARRRFRIADRLSHQHICHGMVSVFRARTRHSKNPGTSDSMD